MSMLNPLRSLCHVGIMSGIPLLALALGTGDAPARSLDRSVGAGASRKTAAPATAGSSTGRTQAAETWRAGTRNHDPCCADDARTPIAPAGSPATGSREAVSPATGPREAAVSSPSDSHPRGKSDVRRGGTRVEKRSSDPRLAPRSTPGEQRRGGVGALIGLTFA
jgi:hypothetical protein